MTVAPRLFAIIARKAPVAVISRRGPSKQVAVLSWDLRDDTITLGQWLKGRIYHHRADLSPDGKHMIYFAADMRWDAATGGSWTAVSRAPWLTALHIFGWGHCWNGGGLFLDNRRYWLNAGGPKTDYPETKLACGLEQVADPPDGVLPAMGEDPVTYFPRLLRDGWTQTGDGAERGCRAIRFEKPVRKGWNLEKTFHAGVWSGPNQEPYWESHRLIGPQGAIDMPRAEWAEVVKSSVVFARDGALWRRRVHAKGPAEEVQIRDFSDMKFSARVAPYSGVERGEWGKKAKSGQIPSKT